MHKRFGDITRPYTTNQTSKYYRIASTWSSRHTPMHPEGRGLESKNVTRPMNLHCTILATFAPNSIRKDGSSNQAAPSPSSRSPTQGQPTPASVPKPIRISPCQKGTKIITLLYKRSHKAVEFHHVSKHIYSSNMEPRIVW